MRKIEPSELIINDDGSVFHLHLRPGQIADIVILVGDPARVERVAAHFDSREFSIGSREFVTVTGSYRGRRMTVLSTGIGVGNIDIVVTELDALANVDFATRTVRAEHKQLTLLRLGTSGALQSDIALGDFIFARTSIGFDGILNFYAGRDGVCDLAMERALTEHTAWNPQLPAPYCVDADEGLWGLFRDATTEGVTVTSPGFYAPQGRYVRVEPADAALNAKLEMFAHNGRRITNFEMESAPLAGLARLLGHRAGTVCTVIAQRVARDVDTDYTPFVDKMIKMSLDKLASLP